MGIFRTKIIMIEIEENGIIGYGIVLSSYYHRKLIFDQNKKIVLDQLTGGFHF